MSRDDYEASLRLAHLPVEALLMAAMRKAHPRAQALLAEAFSRIWMELVQRSNSPDGWLPGERKPRALPPLRLAPATPPVDDVPDQAMRCVCGSPGLPGVLHSATTCRQEDTT